MEKFVLLLSPFAPHMAEELWQALGHDDTLAYEPWPDVRRSGAQGRHDRGAGADQRQAPRPDPGPGRGRQRRAGSAARADAKVAEFLAGKTVVKVIVVPGRMVNFVVK